MDRLCCFLIAIISLAAFIGIFFCVDYPEVKRAKYSPTICQRLSTTISPRFCCNLDCACSSYSKELPKCQSLVSQSQLLSPIACSQNSTLCPKSEYCDYENDNCWCCIKSCKHTNHQKCRMNCVICHD